jgi:predicted nucleic acid-binding protein
MTTFLDTNVLIYLLDKNAPHHLWSVSELDKCRENGPAIISDIVYCEFSIGMATREEADAAITELAIERIRGSTEALFRAGRAYKAYKDNGGRRERVLPDFLIGAIAAVTGAPLITANPADFATYFPGIQLISPQSVL